MTSIKRKSAISATPALNNMKKLSFLLVNIKIRPRAALERKISLSALTILYGGADAVIIEFNCNNGKPEGEEGNVIVNPLLRESFQLWLGCSTI